MTNDINGVSLDFWRTIATPNPEYSKQRNLFLSKISGFSESYCAAVYKSIKKHYDGRAESEGKASTPHECCEALMLPLGLDGECTPMDLEHDFMEMFVENPPTVLDETVEQINRLSKHYKLNICSNTNFIFSSILRKEVLERRGLKFDFELFSDEVGVSKPHKTIFELVKLKHGLNGDQVLHVGDTKSTDFDGALNAGLKAFLIKDANDLPQLLKKL